MYCPFFKQRNKIFFKTNKSKKTNLFSDVQQHFFSQNDNAKDDERTIFEIFQKTKKNFRETVLVKLEDKIDFSEKWCIFSKEQDRKNKKKKKTKQKRRRKTEGVSQKEMKKDKEKGDRMKHEGLGKRTNTLCF